MLRRWSHESDGNVQGGDPENEPGPHPAEWMGSCQHPCSGNSLRGIIKHLKGISDAAISELNLPTAVPYVFEFDDKLRLVKDYFLGDPEQIRKLMEAVANQGKK